jgi:hypothetical protein
MRKFYPNSKVRSQLLLLTISLLFGLLINSCKKELPFKNNQIIQDEKVNIFKEIYEQETNIVSNLEYKTLSAASSSFQMIKAKSVNWDKPFTKQRSASKVTEFEVKEDSIFLALRQFKEGERMNYRNKLSAVFIENIDGTRLNFYMKVIEELSGDYAVPIINEVKYNFTPVRFSGQILYYSLDKKFINGFKYKKGKVVGTVKLFEDNKSQKQTTSNYTKLNDSQCNVEAIYNSWCEWSSHTLNDGSVYYDWHGCHQSIVGYELACSSASQNQPVLVGITGDPNYTPGTNPSGRYVISQSVRNNPKIECILAKLLSENRANTYFLADLINETGLEVEFLVVNSLLDKNGKEINAVTDYTMKTNYMTVTLSAKYFNNTSTSLVSGAKTVIHEMAHMWIARKIQMVGISTEPLSRILKNTDPYLFDLYSRWIDPKTGLAANTPNTELQHEYMSLSLAYDMAIGLSDFVIANQNDNDMILIQDNKIEDYLAFIYSTLEGTLGRELFLANLHETSTDLWNRVHKIENTASGVCK